MTNAKFPLVALRRFVKINPNVVLPTKGEVEYLPMEKVRSGFFEHFVADISTLPSSLNAFAEGDVLMAKVTPCFENGNLCLASNICNQVGCCSTELFVLRPNTTLVLPEYLLFLLQAEEFKQTATKYMRGAGGLKRIPTDWLLNYKFPLPSLDVQAAILRVLHYVESKIQSINDAYHHKIEKLSEYRKSLITRVVTKGLDPNVEMKDSGYEWIGQIPKHWNIARVGVLYRLSNGLSKSGESFGHGLPFLTYGDAYKSTFTPKKLSGLVETTTSERVNYSVKRGDVFFTRTSETVEEIGLSSTCLKDIPDGTFAGFLIRARPLTTLVTPEFAGFYFRSQCHRPFFIKEMNLVTRASLSQGLLSNLPVLIPPLEEQNQIYQYLLESCQNVDSISANLRKTIEELDEYRSSLISAAVTGKLNIEEVTHGE